MPGSRNCSLRPLLTAFIRPRSARSSPLPIRRPTASWSSCKSQETLCRREKPLVIFKDKGVYTPEMEKILGGA